MENAIHEDGGVNVEILPAVGLASDNASSRQKHSKYESKKNKYEGKGFANLLARSWPEISQLATILTIFILLWIVGCMILPWQLIDPSSPFMRLWFLFIGAHLAGALASLVGLLNTIGSLVWGIIYVNVGLANFEGVLEVEAIIGDLSYVNVMLLAGLGVDFDALKSRIWTILQLAIIPTVVEVAIIAMLSLFLLDLPWLWGVLLGLAVTAITPNVVVTSMLFLKEKQFGLNKGIRTMIICMTNFNDYLTKCAFGIVVGLIPLATGDFTNRLLEAPIGVAIALAYGGVCGIGLNYIPSFKAKYNNELRLTITLMVGMLAMFGCKQLGYPSAGAISIMATLITAGTGWKQRPNYEQEILVQPRLCLLWKFLKPVSFALVGKQLNFSLLDGNTVLYGSIVLTIAIVFRLIATYICTLGTDLNRREKAYVMVAGLPKAMVQVLLAPVALEITHSQGADGDHERAQTVLAVTLLSIILSAPLGALIMVKLAPLLLEHGPPAAAPPKNKN